MALPLSRSLPRRPESMTTRRALYYHGQPVMPVYGERAVEAVLHGAPLLVFNSQKGWVPAGPGALARLERAISDNSTSAIMSYCALIPHPIAIGKRGYVPRMAREDVRSISQYVHWTLGRYGYVGVGQVTGDTYSIMPMVEDDVPVFTLAIATISTDPFGPGRMLGKSSRQHKKLMLRADKREARHAVARAG